MDLSKYKMRVTDTHVYFWGGPFSQWFTGRFEGELPVYRGPSGDRPARLVRSGSALPFTSGEKYMMASKSSVFGDVGKGSSLEAIMGSGLLFGETEPPKDTPEYRRFRHGTDDVRKIKEIGRTVPGLAGGRWDEDDIAFWTRASVPAVTLGNLYKFTRSDALYDVLMRMGDRRFVEGSPKDTIWGVGLSFDDPRIGDESKWKGSNRLGDIIGNVRDIVVEHGRDIDPWKVLSRALRQAPASHVPSP